jgi:SPP1 gp7 family putative phage head morphogenesis protein
MLYGPNNQPLATEEEFAAGYGRASIMESLGLDYQNPDEIAREKGLAYYDDVARDPHVKSVWNTRIMALVGCAREIHAASESQGDRQIADFVRWNLEVYLKRRGLDTIVMQTFRSGTKNGYTVQEVLWKNLDRKTLVTDVKDRDPERFLIKNEDLYKKEHTWDIDGIWQPPRKYLVAPFEPEYENPYGTSLFQSVHWYVWFKKNGFKFWVIFLEKFGMPTVVGKIPEGASQQEITKIREVLNSVQSKTNITIPAGFEVFFLEATRTGSVNAGFELLCDKCDQQISKAILGQTLTTQEGQKSGSYALGKIHADVRSDILIADGKWIDTILNWQLIPWLVDYNFTIPQIDMHPNESGVWEADTLFKWGYPYIVTQTQPGEDLKYEVEIDEKLVTMGVRLPQSYFYEKYNRPEPQPGEAIVGQASGPAVSNVPQPQAGAEAFAEETMTTMQSRKSPADALFDHALQAGSPLYRAVFVEPIQRLAQEADSLEAYRQQLDAAPRNSDEFGAWLANTLTSANILGHWVMQQRIEAQSGERQEEFAEDLDVEILAEPLTPEAAAQFIADKQIMTPEEFAALSEDMKRVAFTIAGVEEEKVLELVQDILEEAINEGLTYPEFQKSIEQIFETYGVTEISDHHLRTVFRTNIQTAYHEGTWQMLHDPAVSDILQYLQYDAIDDSRTRPAHAAVDGVTLPLDDPFWDLWWPPNGYNCRCDVIPVTIYRAKADPQTYQVTTEIPDTIDVELQTKTVTLDVAPDKGFAGTPKVGGK